MIFKEYRNFFNLQECNNLIERFRQQVCFHERYRDTIVLKLLNQTFPKLTDVLKKDFNILLNYGQIVYWPPFSHMDCHFVFTIENKDVFTSICYLNDDFEGGETSFPHFNTRTKVGTGTVLLFPCSWSYLHKGNPISSGNPKYVLGTFLNYVDSQKLNRIGDKTLGSEGI